MTAMSWGTVSDDFTRILSYGPAILSTASRTSSRSPSVASPAVPVTITSTVPCPLGWSQSACANRTPWTASAALTKVSSIARAASSDQERERARPKSFVVLCVAAFPDYPILGVGDPVDPVEEREAQVICASGTLYRAPSFSASTRTSTDLAPFAGLPLQQQRTEAPLR